MKHNPGLIILMNKKLAGWSGLILAAGMIIFWGIYQYTGLKHYLSAVKEINRLDGKERDQAFEDFQGGASEELEIYGGILMGVNSRGKSGVWVWGKNGPKYYKGDEYSVYSFFSICKPVILDKLKAGEGEQLTIGQDIETDIKAWAKKVKQGDYVILIITNSQKQGGTIGNLREAKAYDWRPFAPTDIGEQCRKR